MRSSLIALVPLFALLADASPCLAATAKPWQPPTRETAPTPAPGTPGRPRVFVDGVLDTGQFLPDSATLARVGPRRISVRDFREFWFGTPMDDRPGTDSLGRVEFLNSMIDKDVLGLTALAVNRPLDFEDRAVLRAHVQTVLSKTLYRRLVSDSVSASEDEIREFWKLSTYEQRFRRLVFRNRAEAERVHLLLATGKLKWADAARKHAKSHSSTEDELRWIKYEDFDPWLGRELFHLEPGQASHVFEDAEGPQIVQVIERRALDAPGYTASRRLKRDQLLRLIAGQRTSVIRERMRREMELTYDTTNVALIADLFAASKARRSRRAGTIDISNIPPDVADSDTSRVMARWKDGRMTIGDFVHRIMTIPPVVRPDVSTVETALAQVDAISMEPYLADYARSLGFEADPHARWEIDRKQEEIRVGHMFADSITSRVAVSRAERRAYYERNQNQFVTFPAVRFALIVRKNRESADSLAAALRAGADAAAIVRADSLAGVRGSSIRSRRGDRPAAYHALLFEELRPGQVSVQGPDSNGDFGVIQLLVYEAPRQLPFEDVESICDESVQNIKAEQLLKAMLARLRPRFPISADPGLVTRIALTDPTLDD
jgi:hypothetical protein